MRLEGSADRRSRHRPLANVVGLGWLEVECNRCKTRASLPLDAIRRPRDTLLGKLESFAEMPIMPEGAVTRRQCT